jgi:hypothetical protein
VKAVRPPRQAWRNPLYAIVFQLADFLPPAYMNPQLDLSVNCRLAKGELEVQMAFDPSRLSPARTRRLLESTAAVLRSATGDEFAVLGSLIEEVRTV